MNGRTTGASTGRRPVRISGIIGRAMRSLGLSRSYDGWLVVERWAELVGPAIAEQARATRYEDGVLYVSVPDDAWRQQLSMQTESILKTIQTHPSGRAVRRIRLERR